MALIFESIQTDGVAQFSYLIGDDSEGVAAVFDPRADVDCYLQLAHEKQVSITHIFETHIHVDFVSGARELCARVESAKIYLSQEGGARYGFDHEKIADGDNFVLGSALTAGSPIPTHYLWMNKLNVKGPVVHGNLPPVRGLPPKFFQKAIEDDDNVLVDTRMMLAFGGGHIKSAQHRRLAHARHLGRLVAGPQPAYPAGPRVRR